MIRTMKIVVSEIEHGFASIELLALGYLHRSFSELFGRPRVRAGGLTLQAADNFAGLLVDGPGPDDTVH